MGIILENDAVQDKQLGNAILCYLNTPYFRNNTWYLALWKRLFELKHSAEILFLMRMKDIGLLNAWVYLQLHAHFLEKGCLSCAHAILVEGIKAQAYPIESLEEKVNYTIPKEHSLEVPARIRLFGKEWVCVVEYAHLAKTLQKEGRSVTYTEYRIIQHIRKEKRIEEEETEKGLNEVSLMFGSLRNRSTHSEADPLPEKESELEKESEPENLAEKSELSDYLPKRQKTDQVENAHIASTYSAEDLLESSKKETHMIKEFSKEAPSSTDGSPNKSLNIGELSLAYTGSIQEVYKEAFTEITEGPDKADINSEEFLMAPEEDGSPGEADLSKAIDIDICESKNELYSKHGILQNSTVFGSPMVGSKLVIQEMLYIVKKQLGGSSFLATRIASLGDGNVTLNARDYALRSISDISEYTISRELGKTEHTIPIDLAVKYSDKLIVLSAYKEMGALDKALQLIVEKTGYIPETLSAHYVKEVLVIGMCLHKIGYDISACSLKDFVLSVENGKISIKLAMYKNVQLGNAFPARASKMASRILENTRIENTQSLLTHPLPLAQWISKLTAYTAQKKEASLLQSLFITQEVCIYEEAQLV
ncbi:hypothetical protein NERG_01778 [Nematocida ausubeli]|uniref:Uncharacterized protein n=1 Tax=Nematocida ausubeli (strain ATCC PRA-371 / ERTm2) TaxID=1913371 RepID=H8ZDV7_NEMA1|nr:hypothetical protein NERG_01778 [Nematocida ausubeli]